MSSAAKRFRTTCRTSGSYVKATAAGTRDSTVSSSCVRSPIASAADTSASPDDDDFSGHVGRIGVHRPPLAKRGGALREALVAAGEAATQQIGEEGGQRERPGTERRQHAASDRHRRGFDAVLAGCWRRRASARESGSIVPRDQRLPWRLDDVKVPALPTAFAR